MPSLENLQSIFKGEPLAVLTIDVEEEREIVERYIRREGFSFEVFLDIDGEVTSMYSVRAHPKTFLIDPHGKVIGFAEGYRQWDSEEMVSLMASLIGSKGE